MKTNILLQAILLSQSKFDTIASDFEIKHSKPAQFLKIQRVRVKNHPMLALLRPMEVISNQNKLDVKFSYNVIYGTLHSQKKCFQLLLKTTCEN